MIMSLLFASFILFIVQPIFEWGIHNVLHKYNLYIHLRHHKLFNEKKNSLEIWPWVGVVLSYYYGNIWIILGLTKYWIVHSLIHFKPEYVPELAKHHITHHQQKKYNFCVSAIWPDDLFGTLKT